MTQQHNHRTKEQRNHNALTVADRRFVEEYLVDLNTKDASLRAGLPAGSGSGLLGQPRIQLALERERAKRQTRTEIYADEVLRRWWLLATADARELVQLRRGACRYCYGIDNQYQFTKNELRRAIQQHQQALLARRVPQDDWLEFDDLGGDGYDATREPSEDCTECFGIGLPTVWLEDSRNYSAAAALLFDGVKVSKDGSVEIKFRDRNVADGKVGQHLGMLVQRQEITWGDPTKLSNDQLDAALNAFARLQGLGNAPEIEHEDVNFVDELVEVEDGGTSDNAGRSDDVLG